MTEERAEYKTDQLPGMPDLVEKSVFQENDSNGFQLVPLELIDPNPFQPREDIDFEALEKLARGLKIKRNGPLSETRGLMQIPMGREVVGRIQLAFGHRRFLAFQHNRIREDGWDEMPLQVVELNDEEMYDLAARENADRQQLNAIEKAHSIERAKDELGWSLTRAASAHGLSKSAASNLTRLLQLPDEVQAMVASDKLSQRHGREMVRLMQAEPPMVEECHRLAKMCKTGLTVESLWHHVGMALDEQKKQHRRAELEAQTKTRYCHRCGHSGTVTGLQIHNGELAECPNCGNKAYVNAKQFWTTEPPTCQDCGSNKGNPIFATVHLFGDGELIRRCEPCRLKFHNEQMEKEHGPDWNKPKPAPIEPDLNDFGIRYCPECSNHSKFSTQRITDSDELECTHCGFKALPAAWLKTSPQEGGGTEGGRKLRTKQISASPTPPPPNSPTPDKTACTTCGATDPGGAWYHQVSKEGEHSWLCAACSPFYDEPLDTRRDALYTRLRDLANRIATHIDGCSEEKLEGVDAWLVKIEVGFAKI